MATATRTFELTSDVVTGIAMVGKIVTYRGGQFKVHSVEGSTFYAHESSVQVITVDTGMSKADWITDDNPIVMIIPAGHVVGEGFGQEAYLRDLRVGVSLVKSWV